MDLSPRPGLPASPTPLGLNRGGYFGPALDIAPVLEETRTVAGHNGWGIEVFGRSSGFDLLGLRRGPRSGAPRVYVSTGIHGDEPAGPLAVLQLLREDRWPKGVSFWVCPCLNPFGVATNRRTGPGGKDLNRDYRSRREAETRAHVGWLEAQPRFDLALCLHEDWEARGFYLYELNPQDLPSAAERVIRAVEAICPIDHSLEIDGRPARRGIIRPRFDPEERPDWPEAFYLARHKSSRGYTFEAPSDFALPVRVEALVAAVQAVLGANFP